jgi:hypothetical protein
MPHWSGSVSIRSLQRRDALPRINRLRWNKPPRKADRLEPLEQMLKADTIEASEYDPVSKIKNGTGGH